MRVREIRGTIVLADGSTSEFAIGTDFGWQQWGADTPRLGQTVDVVEGMAQGLMDAEVQVESDYDEEETA